MNRETVLEYIKSNPGKTKNSISEITGAKGIVLHNILRKLLSDGEISVTGDGNDGIYNPAEPAPEQAGSEKSITIENNGEITEPSREETNDEVEEQIGNVGTEDAAKEKTEQTTKEPDQTKVTAPKKQSGRNTDTYKFMDVSYNKGKLIHAVVAAHCAKNKNISVEKLRLVFPDTLLKRFGIFQTVEKAREISGAKYDRYFFKEEMQIKLKDAVIVTSNQITGENILPFLDTAAKHGYQIEVE